MPQAELYRQNIQISCREEEGLRSASLVFIPGKQLSSCYREYMIPLQSLQKKQQLAAVSIFLVCLRNGCSSNKPSCIRGMELSVFVELLRSGLALCGLSAWWLTGVKVLVV